MRKAPAAPSVGNPDLVELRSAIRVNGINELAITKLDHLTRFGNVARIAIGYRHKGQLLKAAPSSIYKLRDCIPEYVELPL